MPRGSSSRLNLTHSRGDLYRAVLEGIACGTRHVLETYREIGQDPKTVYAVGGGTKNRVWAQATSDIGAVTQHVRAKTVGASYGDAFLAAVAVGEVDRAAIRTWNPITTQFTPNPDLRGVYERQWSVFHDLYLRTHDLMRYIGS